MRGKEKEPSKVFFPIGRALKNGKPIAMDVFLVRNGIEYIATVGTKEYLRDLKREKERLVKKKSVPVNELVIDPVILVDNFKDMNAIRKMLLGIPISKISPYLTPQQKQK